MTTPTAEQLKTMNLGPEATALVAQMPPALKEEFFKRAAALLANPGQLDAAQVLARIAAQSR